MPRATRVNRAFTRKTRERESVRCDPWSMVGVFYSGVCRMSCRVCASESQSCFPTEIAIHLPGLSTPHVFLFPQVVVCMVSFEHPLARLALFAWVRRSPSSLSSRESAFQANQYLREYQNACFVEILQAGEMKVYLSRKFRNITRATQQTGHNAPFRLCPLTINQSDRSKNSVLLKTRGCRYIRWCQYKCVRYRYCDRRHILP